MAKYNNASVYPPVSAMVAGDSTLINKVSDGAQHLIEFSVLVQSIAAALSESLSNTQVAAPITLGASQEMVSGISGAPVTVTLPLAASFPGKQYMIKNQGTGALTIQRSGADNIDNLTAVVLAQWQSVILISDGVQFWNQF